MPAPPWGVTQPPKLGIEATTATERAEMRSTIGEIERILRQQHELVHTVGFEVLKQEFGGSPALGEKGVLSYTFYLTFFAPTVAIAGEGASCIQVHVNRPTPNPQVSPIEDAVGRLLWVENFKGEPKPNATIVHEGLRWDTPTADRRSGYVTFTRGGRSPWIPVTREEYLRAWLFEHEGKSGDKEASLRKALEKSTYERWLEEAPSRRKEIDDAVATAARMQGRAAADELRKTLEQTEREVTESLKAQDAEERTRNNEVLASSTEGDKLRAEIAALSPAERASPATVRAYGPLVPPDDPDARRMLTTDPDFWRVRRSRAEVHSITIDFHSSGTCHVPAVRDALLKTYNTLDWAAFKRIVERPW